MNWKQGIVGLALLGTGLYGGGFSIEATPHNDVETKINEAAHRVATSSVYDNGLTRSPADDQFGGEEYVPDFHGLGSDLVAAREAYAAENNVNATRLILSNRGYVTDRTGIWPALNPSSWGTKISRDSLDTKLAEITTKSMGLNGFTPVTDEAGVLCEDNGRHIYQAPQDISSDNIVERLNEADVVDAYGSPRLGALQADALLSDDQSDRYVQLQPKRWMDDETVTPKNGVVKTCSFKPDQAY